MGLTLSSQARLRLSVGSTSHREDPYRRFREQPSYNHHSRVLTYQRSTSNGESLATLLMKHELLAANTLFRKRMGKRWTFQDRATGLVRQLDYILVRRRWRNSILNAEPYSTFDSVGSDDRVVSMKVRLSLRVPKPSLRIRYDWKVVFGKSCPSSQIHSRGEKLLSAAG